MRIPIVNDKDEIIGYKDRGNRDSQDIVRATGLWVTDKDGNILLAQRAFSKKHDPGLWGPAVGGTVEEGETYESNIIKEAEEEIGLVNINFNAVNKARVYSCFAKLYTAVVDHDYNFVKQDEEVEDIKWFSKNELEELLEEKPEIFFKNFKELIKLFKYNENKD
ncbi:MAG: NUDIX domain-containing protein [Candidatus Paceibacterota bacterium]|jgi:isopentenyldiphosphate isomerase